MSLVGESHVKKKGMLVGIKIKPLSETKAGCGSSLNWPLKEICVCGSSPSVVSRFKVLILSLFYMQENDLCKVGR